MTTFDLLAELPLEVESYRLEPLSAEISPETFRHCTLVWIHGGGLSGVGEDVVYGEDEQAAFQRAGAVYDLSGRWSLAEFCAAVERLDLFPDGSTQEAYRHYRLWAFHSAALDLALRQSGLPLHRALGREPRPMTYVASTRLGEPPTLDAVSKRLALDPTLRFKLDATSSWDAELIEALVQTGAVDSIDFKGLYKGSPVDQAGDPEMYQRVAAAFPDAWLEDPDLTLPETRAVLASEHDRITWDAPIHSIADIRALPFAPKMVNIKPSRVGSLKQLCAMYDYCADHGIGAYGGGQTELGAGRGQAQYLAALFHPDTPNDLAPSAYNQADPPAGLPSSPLIAEFGEPGFRWPDAS
jgi:L-alanine-DL-glutamate epimerase-like enolase superfamily enzyme